VETKRKRKGKEEITAKREQSIGRWKN